MVKKRLHGVLAFIYKMQYLNIADIVVIVLSAVSMGTGVTCAEQGFRAITEGDEFGAAPALITLGFVNICVPALLVALVLK